jgi:hypothetical protein
MFKSPLLSFAYISHDEITLFSSFSISFFEATGERSNTCQWIDEENKSTLSTNDLFTSSCVQSLQNDSRPIIGSVRNTHLRFFVAVWEAAFDTSLVYLFRDTPCGSRLFFSHGKGYWTRTPVTSAIAFRGAHVSAFKEASLDRSKFLGLFSSLQFCFYLFHPGKHCVAQILHRKQAYVLADAAYSPGVSPQRRPYPWVPHWARKRWIGTSGPVKDVYRATALALWCHTASPETEGTVNLREHLTTWKRCCYESRTEARYEHNENGERVVIATTVGA